MSSSTLQKLLRRMIAEPPMKISTTFSQDPAGEVKCRAMERAMIAGYLSMFPFQTAGPRRSRLIRIRACW
jgi:hypothetical protein